MANVNKIIEHMKAMRELYCLGSSVRQGMKDTFYHNINSENFFALNPNAREKPTWWWRSEYSEPRKQSGELIAKSRAKAKHLFTKSITDIDEFKTLIEYMGYVRYTQSGVHQKIEPCFQRLQDIWDNCQWSMINLRDYHDDYIPNMDEARKLHALHESTDDPFQVAYYPTFRHMREGREVRTRLGKYLTTYASLYGLEEGQIKAMSEKYRSAVAGRGNWQVSFVEHNDVDGWLKAYDTDRVHSCMKGERAVRVYAHDKSVLRLACVTQQDGQVVARCIVRDEGEHTGWLRVYPDPNGCTEGRFLLDHLNANGYPNRTNLDGVLLQYIETSDGIVCPYLDSGNNGDQSVGVETHDNKIYLVAGGREYQADSTNGYVENQSCECEECGDGMNDDDSCYIESTGVTVCECCRDNNYTYAYGRRGQDYYPNDDCIRCESDDDYYTVEWAHSHDVYLCEVTANWYHMDDLCSTSRGLVHVDEGSIIDHADCDGNEYACNSDIHELSDGTKCHEDDAGRLQEEIDELLTEEN